GQDADWLETRIEQHRHATGSFERQQSDGTWSLTRDRRMSNGGIARVRNDISALEAAQAALRDSEQRLDRAQEIAGIGSWEFDLRSRRRVWSKEMYRIRGVLEDEDSSTAAGLARHTDPEDHPRLVAWLEALKQGQHQEPIEFRILRPDG